MPLPLMTHQLSNFEQIEILRHEIEEFEEELKKTESSIRDVLYKVEKQKFLMSVHHSFHSRYDGNESGSLNELYQTRETVSGALDAMKQLLASLEAASGTSAGSAAPQRLPQRPMQAAPTRAAAIAPPSQIQQPGAPVRKNRFDAF